MMHPDDDRTGGEKEQRFEERMRDQMKHRHRIGGCAERNGHIAELRQGRIGDDPLISFCTRPRMPINNAVVAPTAIINDKVDSDSSNNGDIRVTIKMPAVTIVAA